MAETGAFVDAVMKLADPYAEALRISIHFASQDFDGFRTLMEMILKGSEKTEGAPSLKNDPILWQYLIL